MTPSFEFASAGRIVFGVGSIAQAAPAAVELGRRALVVTGANPARADGLVEDLLSVGLTVDRFAVPGEPTVAVVVEGAAVARSVGCDLVIGFGGGSAIDGAKAIAALAVNTEPVATYLEVIGDARPLSETPLPCIAIPTTAGTGCEVTKNAVIRSPEHGVKVSLRHPAMLPAVAIVDPELTRAMPPAVTAATGCDALTQLIEAFLSKKATPMTDALCWEALPRAAQALGRAVDDGDDMAARTDMALAALFSGLALANGGLGAVHGIAGPLGGMIDAPHGAICARLLPLVVEANAKAIMAESPDAPVVERFAALGPILTGDATAGLADAIASLNELIVDLAIPDLGHWGLTPTMVPELVANAQRASSMKGNPVVLSADQLQEIIFEALSG